MKARVNISLSLKITIVVLFISATSVFSILYINIQGFEPINLESLEEDFAESYYHKSHAILQGLNNSIQNSENLNNQEFVQEKITGLVNHSYNEINQIRLLSVNLYDNESKELMVFASSDKESIGNKSNPYYIDGIYCNMQSFTDDHVFYIAEHNEKNHSLVTIFPIKFSDKSEGTYELVISLDNLYASLEGKTNWIILISIIVFFASIIASLYLLRRLIVNPIITFKEKTKIVGKGKLDTNIDMARRDEIGELANAFNEMAKNLKESRDKIEEYNRILESLLTQKDEFIGQLGHDLKNPLQPLVGLLPMMIEKEKDPQIKEALQVMNKNVEYMRDLIFDTLKLAKLRSANVKLDIEDVNLYEKVEEVIDSQKLLFKENEIKVENKIDKKIIVRADKLRISEVIKNLVSNSVKYIHEKKGKIIFDAKPKDKNTIVVSITDTGIGMKKSQIKKVFDEFYKADQFSSDYYSTGLGLSICKRIIDKHGGKIWVDSKGPGKGTTFYFTLKLKSKNN